MADVDDLLAKARVAKEGLPFSSDADIGVYKDPTGGPHDKIFPRGPMFDRSWYSDEHGWREAGRHHADFISAASPDTVIQLIERLRSAEHERDSLRYRLRNVDHQNTLLVDEWWRAAASVEVYEANHGARCDAEQERYATIAESACRMLVQLRDRVEHAAAQTVLESSEFELMEISDDIGSFLSAPGHEVPGLRAAVAARDRTLDACAARIAELLAEHRETAP